MKISSVRLRGFIGIKQGLGVDEVEVDLSGVSGLVALSGPNGMGKSTLLEAGMQPYRMLASRPGALQHHCFLRDSERELFFLYQGHSYRTLVRIDAQSGRQEGFIWEDGVSQVNGKATDYDAYIVKLLGSSNLFFNSVFCAQNSSKISDMTTGELKGLFSEFLKLDQYIAYEETCKQAARTLLVKKDGIQAQIEALDAELREKAKSGIPTLSELNEKKCSIRERVEANALKLKATTEELSGLEAAKVKNDLVKKVSDEIKDREEKVRQELHAATEAFSIDSQAIRHRTRDFEAKIAGIEDALKHKDECVEAQSKKIELEKTLEGFNAKLSTLDGELALARDAVVEKSQIEKDLKNALHIFAVESERDISALEKEITAQELKTSTLEKRDPSCQSNTCLFIAQALRAQDEIPVLKASIEAKRTAYVEGKETRFKTLLEATEAVKVMEDLKKGLEEKHRELSRELEASRADLKEVAAIADRLKDFDTLEATKTGYESRLRDLRETELSVLAKWDVQRTAIMDRLAEILNQKDMLLEEVNPLIERQILGIKTEIQGLELIISSHRDDLEKLNREIAVRGQEDIRCDEISIEIEKLKTKANELLLQSTQWSFLQNACGAKGLRALEIDCVAPSISGYANELLHQTFGPLFSVRFATLDASGREVLDIYAVKPDGSEVLLNNLSGGQKVWTLKALRLAMTLLSKQKTGRNLQTAFCDEEDGALDRDRAKSFINLYRSFSELGGFSDCFYISHKPECVAMADHVLDFVDGGVNVE